LGFNLLLLSLIKDLSVKNFTRCRGEGLLTPHLSLENLLAAGSEKPQQQLFFFPLVSYVKQRICSYV